MRSRRRRGGGWGRNAARGLAALGAALLALPSAAVELRPGDLLVTDTRRKAVVRIDPHTLVREDVTSPEVGGGEVFQFPSDLVLDGAGAILVTDLNRQRVYRVDPATGDRRPLGSGKVAGSLRTLVRSPDGRFAVGFGGHASRLLWFDPSTGAIPPLSGPGRGDGPPFNRPVGVVFEGGGTLLVADRQVGVLRVDAASGDRRPLLPAAEPGATRFEPYDLALAPDGAALVIDHASATLVRIDARSGERRVLSGAGVGGGPAFGEPYALASLADGRVAVVDRRLRSVFRVDPASGARSVIASDLVGSGPTLATPRRIEVVPGGDPAPAPAREPPPPGGTAPRLLAGLALAVALAAAALFARGRRRRAA